MSSAAVVETIDIFPTLCELADLPTPDNAHGVSLAESFGDPSSLGHSAVSYSGRGLRLSTTKEPADGLTPALYHPIIGLLLFLRPAGELYDFHNNSFSDHKYTKIKPKSPLSARIAGNKILIAHIILTYLLTIQSPAFPRQH